MAILLDCYNEEVIPWVDGKPDSIRTVAKFPFKLAPVKYAIMPLVKKDEQMVRTANEIYKNLKSDGIGVQYDDGGSIGKRYRRQDEIWTPYVVTVDYQTLEDWSVTIRDRDTMNQKRIARERITESM